MPSTSRVFFLNNAYKSIAKSIQMSSKIFFKIKRIKKIKETIPPGAGPQLGRSGLRNRKYNFSLCSGASPMESIRIH